MKNNSHHCIDLVVIMKVVDGDLHYGQHFTVDLRKLIPSQQDISLRGLN